MRLDQNLLEKPLIRWSSSFIFVLALYTSLIYIAWSWSPHLHSSTPSPMAAMFVELAPAFTTPHQTALQKAERPPPQQTEPPASKQPTDIPIIEATDAILPLPNKKQKSPPLKVHRKQLPEQQESAPQESPMLSKKRTVPTKGTPSSSMHADSRTNKWQSELLGHLEKYKRYPRKARRRNHQGVVYVSVKINRKGNVLEHRIITSCPYKSLNKETLALIKRAQPLPPPPVEVAGLTVDFIVPIAFTLTH